MKNNLEKIFRSPKSLIQIIVAVSAIIVSMISWNNYNNLTSTFEGRVRDYLQSFDSVLTDIDREFITCSPELFESLVYARMRANIDSVYSMISMYEESLSICRSAYTSMSDSVLYEGLLRLSNKDFEGAAESFRRVLKAQPDNGEAWYYLAYALRSINKLNEALAAYDSSLCYQSANEYAWFERGIVLANLGNIYMAASSMDSALAYRNDDASIWNEKGRLLLKLNCYEAAIACFDSAIAYNPNDYKVWHNRGAALIFLQRYDDAYASIDQGRKSLPRN